MRSQAIYRDSAPLVVVQADVPLRERFDCIVSLRDASEDE